MATRLLILGGTTEARTLAARIALLPGYAAILSLAGRTATPLPQAVPVRIGGFGGAAGLVGYLRTEKIDALIVATHPFAARIAANAALAANETGIPAVRLIRPPWQAGPGDDWRLFSSLEDLVAGLGERPRRVLVTIGRQEAHAFAVAPQHHYWFRSIEPIEPPLALPDAEFLLERGPFAVDDEVALLRRLQIETLVTKNSGGEATRAKLDAARALGLPVMMVARPPASGLPEVETIDALLDFLRHHAPPAERGA
ncbi:precorrin-6A/cobalt-precorrin-6A reductase [Kaistia soli DSM 19436]|uniref:Precorrin-6A/cobalt-precorrin-6A reductase n=1 Tax=Kaistia soli DSM 19436 TaxID=1122133 RepID=A0A1M4X801_9HYPH|nr:cobalt-precorrin-6A reductase [Kaistia soli]SHE89292.1 precorrin-6A/cobalt-precorrin-6A reductase [Kaistia soli DSM 19436]